MGWWGGEVPLYDLLTQFENSDRESGDDANLNSAPRWRGALKIRVILIIRGQTYKKANYTLEV